MNILIKLMSIVSLVIAPYIAVIPTEGEEGGCGHHGMEKACSMGGDMEGCHHKMMGSCCQNKMEGEMKCDMEKCMSMSKEECAAYCDSMKCSPEEKAFCVEHAGTGMGEEGGHHCMHKGGEEGKSSCMEGCSHGCKSKEECMEKCGESCSKMHKE